MMRSVLSLFVLLLVLPAGVASAQTVDSVAPESLVRGRVTNVLVRGSGLDVISTASLDGDSVEVVSVTALDETVEVTLAVGDRATSGPRTLTLDVDGGDPILLDDAFTIVPGPVAILRLEPNSGARGDVLDVALVGRNLDAASALELGDGITVSDWEASSPTAASATVEITDAAFSGLRDVVLVTDGLPYTLPSAFEVQGAAPTLGTLTPSSGVRGTSFDATLTGTNLDRVSTVSFGSRVAVRDFAVVSPTEAALTIEVLEDATAGARDLEATWGEGTLVDEGGFTVEPGEMAIERIRPERVTQGDETIFFIDGRNLDGVDGFDAGSSITVDGIESSFPTSISVDVSVSFEAEVGLRDITISGPNGSITLPSRLAVAEYVLPDPAVDFSDELQFRTTQVNARQEDNLFVENLGEIAETVTVGPGIGDSNLFTLLDPESGEPVASLTFTLEPAESLIIPARFSPISRGTNGVRFPITVRDEEELGDMILRGSGASQELLFESEPPVDLGEVEVGVSNVLDRIDTTTANGISPRSAAIEEVRFELTRDGVSVEDAAALFEFEINRVTSIDRDFWGSVEMDWSVTPNAPGIYEGNVVFSTDAVSAPTLPFAFSFVAVGEGGEDVGADAGADAGGSDAGTDAGPDAGTQDTGAPDTTVPDTTTPDTATGDAATGADTTSDNDTGGGGGGGGCAATPNAPTPWLLLLGALGFITRRARESRLT